MRRRCDPDKKTGGNGCMVYMQRRGHLVDFGCFVRGRVDVVGFD